MPAKGEVKGTPPPPLPPPVNGAGDEDINNKRAASVGDSDQLRDELEDLVKKEVDVSWNIYPLVLRSEGRMGENIILFL